MDEDSCDEQSKLLRNRTRGECRSRSNSVDVEGRSCETIVFDCRMVKTSTQVDELAATWGGRGSVGPDSRRLRRAQSWSGIPPDDVSSEIRILRERLVVFFRMRYLFLLDHNQDLF